jgi:hypothetical protein
MKKWRIVTSILIAIISVGYILVGIPLLFEPFPEVIIGLIMVLFIGGLLPYTWLLDCYYAKEKGE